MIQTSSGGTYKSLSLICWEAFVDPEIQVKIGDKIHYKPKKWVTDGTPYDIMLHSKDTTDTEASEIFSYAQNLVIHPDIENTIKDFKHYYSLYFKLLKSNAPLVIADRSESGIFAQDLSNFKNFHKTKDYALIRI